MILYRSFGRLIALAALAGLLLSAGCAAHRPGAKTASAPSAEGVSSPPASSEGSAPAAAPYVAPTRIAFAAEARILVEDVESRKMKLRFYGQAPDRFRIEVRGPVGGIVLVATGRGGRIRVVVPSRRRYSEGAMDEELAADLVGVPMTGCDLAMVVRISSGFKKFHPCGGEDPAQDMPLTDSDRPGLIVDTTPQGAELIRFGWDWSGEGPFPKEMRVESLAPPQTSLALTGFKRLDAPEATDDDFYWEPLPAGATLVPIGQLGDVADR